VEASCDECGGTIKIPKDAVAGEIVSCPDCGLEYEIGKISNDKVELKPAETVGEDWGE